MSSDSEDDCYGNMAKRLDSMKSKYKEDLLNTSNLLNSSQPELSKTASKVIEITDNSSYNAQKELKDDSDVEEISLDAIIAQNSKKRATRRSKRHLDNSDISMDNIIPTRGRKRSGACKTKTVDLDTSRNVSDMSAETSNISNNSGNRTRNRGRARGRSTRGQTSSNLSTDTSVTTSTSSNVSNTDTTTNTSARGTIPNYFHRTSPRGARSRSTPRGRNRRQARQRYSIPTYSVGNTDEYPDESYNQPLFNQTKKEDVITIENEPELNDSLDENEELSVKVYWQNRECIKFCIRRFQKLQQIFDFFAKRENVSHDKLFFTYNEKILKMDDTPDSITYSIVKFIDGGIINQSVSNIVQKDTSVRDGIKLKFQCQNAKKPFETYVKREEKLVTAMMKCSEHLEMSLDKLKFLFDGDVITGKMTPQDLDLEGGECIDVKIIS